MAEKILNEGIEDLDPEFEAFGLDRLFSVDTLYLMKTKVSRWGNSLALRLPKKLATSRGIVEEAEVEILEREDGLLLRPSRRRAYDLDELLAKVNRKNLHGEVPTGGARGQETW